MQGQKNAFSSGIRKEEKQKEKRKIKQTKEVKLKLQRMELMLDTGILLKSWKIFLIAL